MSDDHSRAGFPFLFENEPSMKTLQATWIAPALLVVPLATWHATFAWSAEVRDLAGNWELAIGGRPDTLPATFPETIMLPGTTVTQHKGAENKQVDARGWSENYQSPGRAWYQRDIDIPSAWSGKRIVLFLERTRPSRLWADGKEVACQMQTRSTPHVYDLSALGPGKHRLSILIDSANQPPIKTGHETVLQGAWNGIIGRIELRMTDPVWIERVRLTPDLAANVTHAEVTIGNRTGKPLAGSVSLSACCVNAPRKHQTATASASFAVTAEGGMVKVDLPMGEDAPRWDEFSPAFFESAVELKAGPYADARKEPFGFREFRRDGRRLTINGRPVFLRGTHDGAVWPLTGHPPMTADGWQRYFTQLKTWGLNHVRFHSWCPPAAAFEMADQLGIYLQPEVHWFGVNPSTHEQEEYGLMVARQLADWYGNHASFCQITFGNEGGGGSQEIMARMVKAAKDYDPRHLWSNITNNQSAWGYTKYDDFFVSFGSRRPDGVSHASRGSNAYPEAAPRGSHITFGPPHTLADFHEAVADMPIPMISHETGQFQVYPNFDEITKYTGVKRATNYEYFRQCLAEPGMGDQWRDFFRASGRLAAINYREDIEASLRTPQFGGFQLLDIKDYPGQGTALVGLWDVFLDNKGAIEPQQWREFCCETVPLLRFAKYTWTSSETFRAKAQVAHYGPADWSGMIYWTLCADGGRALASGSLGQHKLKTGEVHDVGDLAVPLAGAATPARFEIIVELVGTPYRNRWNLWVYPPRVSEQVPAGVTVARHLDDRVKSALIAGGRVLLYPPAQELSNTIKGLFQSDFWCYSMFNRHAVWAGGTGLPPGTLGMLTDPGHPIFQSFPTEFYSDYQWWHILDQARVMVLDDTPKPYRPIVQVIDNVCRNHKLGIIWEARSGGGKLVVCSSPLPDLSITHPEARQLHRALLDYVGSEAFQPRDTFDMELLEKLLCPMQHIARSAVATASSQRERQYAACMVVDGRLDTYWLAAKNTPEAGSETVVDGKLVTDAARENRNEWLRLDFPKPTDIHSLRIYWLADCIYRYRVEGSSDGKTWAVLSDQSQNRLRQSIHDLNIHATGLRGLRIVCGRADLGKPAIREIEVK